MTLVANAVEAVLDRKKLKWDALWHLVGWLLDQKETHGLGNAVVNDFCRYIFGISPVGCDLKCEFRLQEAKDGQSKWPDLVLAVPSFDSPTHVVVMDDVDLRSPGSKRKIDNLMSYGHLARKQFPSAILRTVVLTNANDGSTLQKLYAAFGPEAGDCRLSDGWKLLPLRELGEWVHAAIGSSDMASGKMNLFLQDFVEWTKSLDPLHNR